MAAKPIVDGIERDYESRLMVIRLNVQEPAGRELAERFRFRTTPTFILFDPEGEQLLRSVGAVDPIQVRSALEASDSPAEQDL